MDMNERAFIIDKQLQGLVHRYSDESTVNILGGRHDAGGRKSQARKDEAVIGMQAIVDAVLNPQAEKSKQTRTRVNTSIRYFLWYKQALNLLSAMQSQQQAAARTASLVKVDFVRTGDGFTVKIIYEPKTVLATAQNIGATQQLNEAYIVLSLDAEQNSTSAESIYMHCERQQQIHVMHLNCVGFNKYQAIVSAVDKCVAAIEDDESHLYLTLNVKK